MSNKSNWKKGDLHRGQWLKNTIRKSDKKVEQIASEINRSRSTIWRWFGTPNLSFDKIELVLTTLNMKLSDHFPEFRNEEVIEEKDIYKEKYFQAIDELAKLNNEFRKYRESHP